MNDERVPLRPGPPGEPESGLALARVRRRGESHLLALISAATVVFVAIAIAKPWGGTAPPVASAATPSPAAEIAASLAESTPPLEASAATPPWPLATATETTQTVLIVLQPGEVQMPGSEACTYYYYAVPTSMDTQGGIAADPSGAQYFILEPITGLAGDAHVLDCTGGDQQGFERVQPDPTAP